MNDRVTRRTVLAAGAGIAATPALAACADPSEDPSFDVRARAESGTFLVDAGDVPVGGCYVNAKAATVVTRPEADVYKAFSGVCTHKHCFLASSAQGVVPCRCHGSTFSLSDGSVVTGPATKALAEYEIDIADGRISLA